MTPCSKLLRNKDLFVMLGHSWRWRALAAALPLWALALPAHAQSAPADLPVTRLQGGGAASGVFTPSAPQPGPGPEALGPGLPVTQLADRASADLDGPRRIALSLARPMPLVTTTTWPRFV